MNTKTPVPTCEVHVTIAVSEGGEQRCCVAHSPWLLQKREYEKFMADLRSSKALWHVKTVRVAVPMPFSFEDMTTPRASHE